MVIPSSIIKYIVSRSLNYRKNTNVKMSWFRYFSYWGLLGLMFLRSHARRLPLLANPFPPVKRVSSMICIARTSSLWPLRTLTTLIATRSHIVTFLSHAVSITFRSGSTRTYLTRPGKWGPDKSAMIFVSYKSQIFKDLVPEEMSMFAWVAIDKTEELCASNLLMHSHLLAVYSIPYWN